MHCNDLTINVLVIDLRLVLTLPTISALSQVELVAVKSCKIADWSTTRIQIEIPEIRLLHCSSELRFWKSTLVVYQHCLRNVLGREAKDARDGIK